MYRLLPRPTGRKLFLLLASYVMYASFDLRFVFILIGITAATYFLGRAIYRGLHPHLYTLLSIALNLGALAYFKYAGFFLANVETILKGIGILPPASLQILLPIGISFYTFQAIAYTIELSRRKIQPAANVVDFGLYLAFFPKLIAGPFVRPAEFLPQLANPPILSLRRPDLLRFFRIYRHRARVRRPAGVFPPGEFPSAVFFPVSRRFLESVAHDPHPMVPGVFVFPAQPLGNDPEPAPVPAIDSKRGDNDYDDPRRGMARRVVDVHIVGSLARAAGCRRSMAAIPAQSMVGKDSCRRGNLPSGRHRLDSFPFTFFGGNRPFLGGNTLV
jgi:hypothetical protein